MASRRPITAGPPVPLKAIEETDVESARRQTFAQKFLAGAELFDYACTIAESGIRMQHPAFTDEQVRAELRRRIAIGSIATGKRPPDFDDSRVNRRGGMLQFSPMTLALEIPPLPLRADENGVVRVGGTRVTLDTIVAAFREGATAEEIADQYSSVGLADVYAVIGFYLARKDDVEAYLREREALANDARRQIDRQSDRTDFRERLLKRRAEKATGS